MASNMPTSVRCLARSGKKWVKMRSNRGRLRLMRPRSCTSYSILLTKIILDGKPREIPWKKRGTSTKKTRYFPEGLQQFETAIYQGISSRIRTVISSISQLSITCGIPQGSVLGPLLFNIYINDITEVSTKFDFIMYANDTTLTSTIENFGKITDVASLESELNEEILKIYCWLLSNRLTLNTAKSKFIIFFKHPQVIPRLNLK